MGGQTPRRVRFKHAVLEDKLLSVGPVVGNFSLIVVAHHVGLAVLAARRVLGRSARLAAARMLLGDKPVHLPAINVDGCLAFAVRPTEVTVVGIVVRAYAQTGSWVGYADARDPVLHGDAVRAWKSAEVGIERAVLLHDDNYVLDRECLCSGHVHQLQSTPSTAKAGQNNNDGTNNDEFDRVPDTAHQTLDFKFATAKLFTSVCSTSCRGRARTDHAAADDAVNRLLQSCHQAGRGPVAQAAGGAAGGGGLFRYGFD